jgi:hypothetical protein
MTPEKIEEMAQKSRSDNTIVEIRFKTRNPIKGLFIKTSDYDELSRKNLWRIVSERHIEEYKKSHDESLARIFNGAEFTRLDPFLR